MENEVGDKAQACHVWRSFLPSLIVAVGELLVRALRSRFLLAQGRHALTDALVHFGKGRGEHRSRDIWVLISHRWTQ
jgi:hypothetical protein